MVGGGVAGLAAAIGLRTAGGLDVLVAEARGKPAERFGESLPPDIVLALERLGCVDAFRAGGHLRCPGSISAWGRSRPGHSDFILSPLGPAWRIDRARFETMLGARAVELGASLWTGARAGPVARAPEGGARAPEGSFEIVMHDGRSVRADWVIDASGPGAWFARGRGARRRREDALVACVRLARIRDGAFTAQTLVEAAPYGWWYCARLPSMRLVTILVADPSAARAVCDPARWRQLLAATHLLAPRLRACALDDERFRACAVRSGILDRVAGERWLSIGDAAAARDPLLARGIHDALADAADVTQVIAAAAGRGPVPSWRYPERVAARFQEYRAIREQLYAGEQRWAREPFWVRRRTASQGELRGSVGVR